MTEKKAFAILSCGKGSVRIMRNKCLDGMKAIAACMVIFIHIDLPGQTGVFIEALSRFAVPFFFMISGYFCYYNGKDASD